MGFLRPAAGLFPVAVVVLLGSGLYMMSRAWSLGTPFVAVGLTTVVLMAAVGASVLRSRFEVIGRASAEAGDGPIPPQIDRMVASPVTWVVLSAINGATLGVVWVMTNKPGWAAAPAIVAALAAVGGGVGAYLAGRRTGQRSGARPARLDPTKTA